MNKFDKGWHEVNWTPIEPPFSALDAVAFVLALFGIVGLILIVGG